MGENLVDLYRDKVKKEWKIAFFVAFVSCFLIHIYKFTNTLQNHDSFFNVYSDQDMTISGRWFLQYACGISSYFDLPWINGLLCTVYLSCTAVAVAELFKIRNPVVISLSALILIATPSTTETLFFGFTADGYLLGLVLSAVAACFSCKGKKVWHFILSGVCLCLSCAIYQAYISFAVVLCICYLVLQLLNREISILDSWKWIGKHILIYGGALAAYYGIWKLVLHVTGQTATDYQGINEVGKVSISTLISGAVKSIKNILFYLLEWNILKHPITLYAVLNLVFSVAFVGVLLVALVKSKTYKNLPRLLMVLFCLAACVPVISMWNFFSESMDYRPMMLHSICVIYIFALLLFDIWVRPKISTLFGLFMAVVVFNFAIMANISYFYLDKCYEKSYYMGSQMMVRIDEINIEHNIQSIAFVGNRKEEVIVSNYMPGNKVHMLTELIEEDWVFDHEHTYRYLNNVFGIDIPEVTTAQLEALEQTDLVKQMGIWPAEDSVAEIDGVLVVKLADVIE